MRGGLLRLSCSEEAHEGTGVIALVPGVAEKRRREEVEVLRMSTCRSGSIELVAVKVSARPTN